MDRSTPFMIASLYVSPLNLLSSVSVVGQEDFVTTSHLFVSERPFRFSQMTLSFPLQELSRPL